jgi:hypothetical protein
VVVPKRTYRATGVGGWAVSCLLLYAVVGRAEDFRLESVGARGGIPGNRSSRYFNQAELFADWDLPWDWDVVKEWRVQSRLEFSAGWLGDFGDNASIWTLGPLLVLGRERLPVSLVGGVSPTILSRTVFGSKDFGINFQFTTHIGVNFDFARHWRLTYQYQHMSDAHLSSKNPGLNIQFFGLCYVF